VRSRRFSPDQLLIAKTASEDLRELFLTSISTRAAAAMREDLALLPPMRLSEVEAAQRTIVEAAQRLATEGKITLPGGDKEKLV
jgi:flagellar motor switch protein FliG